MALRTILGFDHIPNVSSASSAAAFAKMLAGFPLLNRAYTGNTKSFLFGGPSNPVLAVGITTSVLAAYWVFDAPKVIKNTPRASVFGARIKFATLGAPASGNGAIVLSLASLQWSMNDTNRLPCFLLSDFLEEGEDYTVLQGQERYVEIKINYATGVIERRVEGVPLANLTAAPAAVLTAVQARSIGVYMIGAAAANAQWNWKDIYWLDDTEDDTLCDFLGPQIVLPAALTVEQAAGWGYSAGGSVNAVLNTPVNVTTPDAPYLISPESAVPVVAGLAVSDARVGKVNGVTVIPGVAKGSGSFVNADFKFTLAGQSTPTRRLVLTTTLTHNLLMEAFEKAPDGTPWTLEKVTSSKLNLAAGQ